MFLQYRQLLLDRLGPHILIYHLYQKPELHPVYLFQVFATKMVLAINVQSRSPDLPKWMPEE